MDLDLSDRIDLPKLCSEKERIDLSGCSGRGHLVLVCAADYALFYV